MSGSKIWLPRPWWEFMSRKTVDQYWLWCRKIFISIVTVQGSLEEVDLEQVWKLSNKGMSAYLRVLSPEYDPRTYDKPEDAHLQLLAISFLKESSSEEEAKERFQNWTLDLVVGGIAMEELQTRVARVPPSLSLLGALKSTKQRDVERHWATIYDWYRRALRKDSHFRRTVSILAESGVGWALAADDVFGVVDEALVTEFRSILGPLESSRLELLRRLTSGQVAKTLYRAVKCDIIDEERKALRRKGTEIPGVEEVHLAVEDVQAKLEEIIGSETGEKLVRWAAFQEDPDIEKILRLRLSGDAPPSIRKIAKTLNKSRNFVRRRLELIQEELRRIIEDNC